MRVFLFHSVFVLLKDGLKISTWSRKILRTWWYCSPVAVELSFACDEELWIGFLAKRTRFLADEGANDVEVDEDEEDEEIEDGAADQAAAVAVAAVWDWGCSNCNVRIDFDQTAAVWARCVATSGLRAIFLVSSWTILVDSVSGDFMGARTSSDGLGATKPGGVFLDLFAFSSSLVLTAATAAADDDDPTVVAMVASSLLVKSSPPAGPRL